MITFIQKEFRLVRTALIVALLLAVLPVWFQDVMATDAAGAPEAPWWLLWFGGGAFLLGLAPFGQEFNFRTFNLLLVQPQLRHRLFFLKTATAAIAMLAVWLALYLSCQFRFAGVATAQPVEEWLAAAALVAVVAFSGGLWTTLLFRQITAALLFTLFTPLILFATAGGFLAFLNAFNPLPPVPGAPVVVQTGAPVALFWVMLVYSGAGLWWARWQFLNAQDAQWFGGLLFIPRLFRRRRGAGGRQGRFASLIGKELQLQQFAVLFSLIVAFVYLAAVLLCAKSPASYHYPFREMPPFQRWLHLCTYWFGAVFFAIPGLLGAAAVAEERRLGVMESFWHIPLGRIRQFVAKVGVVLLLTFLLGVVMVCIIDTIAGARSVSTCFHADHWRLGQAFLVELMQLSVVAGIVAVVSFYASTLSRNTGQALGVAAGLCVGVALPLKAFGDSPYADDFYNYPSKLLLIVGCTTALIVLLSLSYHNYKRLKIGGSVVVRNVVVWLGALLFIPIAALGIYCRPWELAMSLEPPHGAPQLNLSGCASIHETRAGYFVLLPDGRLWAPQNLRVSEQRKYNWGLEVEAVPEKGTFIGGGNWADVGMWAQYGIKLDGSLWKISPSNLGQHTNISMDVDSRSGTGATFHLVYQVERIGTGSDWIMLSSTFNTDLALKRDGSLWGWGNNWGSVLGEGPDQLINDPVRLGNDSDWAAVSIQRNRVTAIKNDGSVWQWGSLPVPRPKSSRSWDQRPYYATPMLWTTAGTNWVMLDGPGRFLALHEHGAMWAFGGEVGQPNLDWIGPDTEWQRVENGRTFPEFKKKFNQIAMRNGHGLKYSLSKYSDWVAPGDWLGRWSGVMPVGLAADGTLSVWELSPGLLAPTHRPLWSINILNDK